jgi:glycine dehydrogenase subunit 1
LKEVAELCRAKAAYAQQRFRAIPGVRVADDAPVFNEFAVHLPVNAGHLVGRLIERGMAPGLPLGRFYRGMENWLLVAVTEKRTRFEIGMLAESIEAVLAAGTLPEGPDEA